MTTVLLESHRRRARICCGYGVRARRFVPSRNDSKLLRRLRRVGRPVLEPAQIRQAEMQHLGLLLGGE
ncbi:MAG: hypothetical protein QOF09_3247 [Alphaproteobacteria bacterium]|nr:hypothetical protein [Alphaproteobacteria bacterium]